MTKPNSVEISFKDKSKFEEIKNPVSEKKYAGRYHYEDCPFPTVDQGVCNCPDGLKPISEKTENKTNPPVSEGKKEGDK